MLSSAFWVADPRTRGLSPLAVCLLLRATSESLVGMLERSPRSLATAHPGVTPDQVLAAIDELSGRGLVRWWPDCELLVVFGAAGQAKGKAKISADMLLAQYPPDVVAYARGVAFDTLAHANGVSNGAWPSNEQEHQHQHQQRSAVADPVVAALPLRLIAELPPPAKRPRKPKRDHGAEVEAVLARIDEHRVRLGETALPPYKREPKTIRARLNDDGVDLALVLAVVDARAEDCERNPGQRDYFDAVSPFTKGAEGKGGWPISLRMLERRAKPQGPGPGGAAPFGVNPATGRAYRSDAERIDVERLQAEGERIVAERKGGGR